MDIDESISCLVSKHACPFEIATLISPNVALRQLNRLAASSPASMPGMLQISAMLISEMGTLASREGVHDVDLADAVKSLRATDHRHFAMVLATLPDKHASDQKIAELVREYVASLVGKSTAARSPHLSLSFLKSAWASIPQPTILGIKWAAGFAALLAFTIGALFLMAPGPGPATNILVEQPGPSDFVAQQEPTSADPAPSAEDGRVFDNGHEGSATPPVVTDLTEAERQVLRGLPPLSIGGRKSMSPTEFFAAQHGAAEPLLDRPR